MGIRFYFSAAIAAAGIVLATVSLCAARQDAANPQGPPCIIPQPVELTVQTGSFKFTTDTRVVAVGRARAEAAKLIDYLAPAMGFRLTLTDQTAADDNAVRLVLAPPAETDGKLGDEGCQLDVTSRTIRIRANTPAGLFYGVQTLRQLLSPAVFGRQAARQAEWTVPCVHIVDHPRFAWRGLLIDPARHFIPVADVNRFIDAMAIHKFNRLQIHLTDDQGWRIEIKKYPQLTNVGAWMDFTAILAPASPAPAGPRPGGFYTQKDIRELVQYAARQYITLVPEIEMPAHTGAAIVSCPRIGLYPEKLAAMPAADRWRSNERILAPRPRTVAFMQDVLTEVMELFPGKYIHIGGDEANMDHWKQSDEMQALIRELAVGDEAGLHSWFIRRMDTFLTQHGRRLIGWDEILQGGLAPGAIVMSWRGQDGGITAAKAGHDVIMAPTSHTYFDYYQGPAANEPKAIGGDLPLETVYAFEPVPAALDADQAARVLGGQGQLWGEFIATEKHREYMTWPRAAALCEVLWSPKAGRGYDEFLTRLSTHLHRLDAAAINCRPIK